MSIVVSGLVDHVKECCHKVGLEPHTVESSLGRIGRTDLLPPNEILEIATMCGHSMVSVNFINEMIEKCRKGRCTPEEGCRRAVQALHVRHFQHRPRSYADSQNDRGVIPEAESVCFIKYK